jgi:hypothetical protein
MCNTILFLLGFGACWNQIYVKTKKNMKKQIIAIGLALLSACAAQATLPTFVPGRLAVLQLGDGGTNRNSGGDGKTTPYTNAFASDILGCRQTQYFIDEFDPSGINQTNPDYQIAIPTNDVSGGIFCNGNAGTEAILTLSSDKSELAFAGYTGDMLSDFTGFQTAPSNLSYNRGIATVDAFGTFTRVYNGGGWYGIATGKTNPRGVATDGAGHFWGCGNGYGSLYYDASSGGQPIQFQNIDLTSFVKIFNGSLYTSVKAGDVNNGLYPAGIYSFVDNSYNPVPLPNFLTFLQLVFPVQAPYTNNIGFDINPAGNIAYVADPGKFGKGAEIGGIQKYVKNGTGWTMAYNLAIPGYTNQTTGILADPKNSNILIGAFSVTVDWSGTYPVIYATTSDCGNDNGDPYYGNRVIRILDTNAVATGGTIVLTTNLNILTTVARPGKDANGIAITNMVYKSVTFTPDLRPQITNNPANWSAASGDSLSFAVGASSPVALSYFWSSNGIAILPSNNASAATANLNLASVTTAYNGSVYQCIVSNNYGTATSSVATLLVTSTRLAPVLGAIKNQTNFIGSTFTIAANVTAGTDPKSYQWYFNGNAISDGSLGDGASYAGTANSVLTINNAQSGEQGTFSLVVTNLAGSASNGVANLTLNNPKPSIVIPPTGTSAFIGGNASFTVQAYDGTVNGSSLTYTWYASTNGKSATPTVLATLSGSEYSGASANNTLTSTLNITGAIAADATNYVVVVSNSGGSVTSTPAALSLQVKPYHAFLFYTNGAVYTQDFNTLPINGGGSADAANPNSIQTELLGPVLAQTNFDLTAGGPLNVYSLDNPCDFTYPIIPSGLVGGLGISSLNGWYAWCSSTLQFGATSGDQSAGGIIDLGQNFTAPTTALAGITNRALGIIATTKTRSAAFGLGIVNKTTNTLNYVNLSFIGELWRNNPAQQIIGFSYAVDTAGTNSTFIPGTPDQSTPTSWPSPPTAVHALDIAFNTNGVTSINDGTQATNQVSLSTNSMAVTGWTPGSTLWLVWEAQNPQGGAQAVAIDNLSFSASATLPATVITPVNINTSSIHLTGGSSSAASFTFTNAPGLSFSVLGTNNIAAPRANWPVVGTATESPANSGNYQFTDPSPATNSTRFYILRQP